MHANLTLAYMILDNIATMSPRGTLGRYHPIRGHNF